MKLSIITINKDNAEGLQKTLDSVACQTWHDFEHIIVDGASADSSVDIIRNYAADVHPYPVKWLSEPDTGIYNAMNKGIRMANGEYCLFLNSGDYLYNFNVLNEVFSIPFTEDIVTTDFMASTGDFGDMPNSVDIVRMWTTTIAHQSTFHKSTLLSSKGYNENFKYVSDWIFLFEQLIFNGASYRKLDIILNECQPGSSYDTSAIPIERKKYLTQKFPNEIYCAIDNYVKIKNSTEYYEYLQIRKNRLLRKIFKICISIHEYFCR